MKNLAIVILIFAFLVIGCGYSRGRGKNSPGSRRVSNKAERVQSEDETSQTQSDEPPVTDDSNAAPNKAERTIDDFVRTEVGIYKITNTISGNPSKDGFPGALEEKQYKYAGAGGSFAIHYTIARYKTDAEAQQALRDSIANFKKLGIKTSEIVTANDNDGKLVGISADMFTKTSLMSRFWTKHEFFIRILGDQKEVENFFAAH
ncbi:MAG TPA: hypothetical protein VNB22_06595 [Pyrinomonadaceae bacterium]|jgi:hypothetical protein|nr:hypothetical protein [Pyrinomonadaceae bacterium]